MARINRRDEDLSLSDHSDFKADLLAIVRAQELRTEQPVPGRAEPYRWVAKDLTVDATETFLSGTIGFTTTERIYDDEPESWAKAGRELPDAGSDRSIVPFAVDLRDDRRWIGFGTSQKIRQATFCTHFEDALNRAVDTLDLLALRWEVDLVSSMEDLDEWLREHPLIKKVTRILKMPNPQRDLSEERAAMRALRATRKREEWTTSDRGQHLRVSSQEFRTLLDGIEEGYVEIILAEGSRGEVYNSKRRAEVVQVPDWADDLIQGMAAVQDAVANYSARRAGENPGGLL